jgi:hypothetical protein
MTTQTLEFNAPSGLTLSCKLFAIGSDTVIATQTASEKTNDKNRYAVEFEDIPAGVYRLNAFVETVGGFANELYDLEPVTKTFLPRGEYSPEPVGIYQITVNVTSGGVGVAGCGISIAGLGTIPRTNLQGQAIISVDSGTYQLRVLPPTGFLGVPNINAVVSDEDITVPVVLTSTMMPENLPPGICRLFTYVIDGEGKPVEGVVLKATLMDLNVTTTSVAVAIAPVQAVSDENGYVGVDVIQGGQIITGNKKYRIELFDTNNKVRLRINAVIPDQDSYNIKDLVGV